VELSHEVFGFLKANKFKGSRVLFKKSYDTCTTNAFFAFHSFLRISKIAPELISGVYSF